MPYSMSRGYHRSYNRKMGGIAQTSFQFDKLFHENSSRPTAAKSAGTVGKWGVISYTSIRSTNINGGRDDNYSNKRLKSDYSHFSKKNSAVTKDPFSFEEKNPPPAKVVDSKPRKFFKSRNNDSPAEDIHSNAAAMLSNDHEEDSLKSHVGKKSEKYSKLGSSSKKNFPSKSEPTSSVVDNLGEQTEAMNLSSPIKNAAREENKPPIVLRIFKGTSHLICEPCDPQENAVVNKISTRQSNVVRTNVVPASSTKRRTRSSYLSDSEVQSVFDEDINSPPGSISNSPKKNSNKQKYNNTCDQQGTNKSLVVRIKSPVHTIAPVVEDYEDEDDDDEEEPDDSSDEDFTLKRTSTKKIKKKEKKIEEKKIEERKVEKIEDKKVEKVEIEKNIEEQKVEEPKSPVPEIPKEEIQEEPHEEPLVDVSQETRENVSEVVEQEDQEKLKIGEEILTDTFVDFSKAAEKLMVPTIKIKAGVIVSSNSNLKDNWMSDSEESDTVNDGSNIETPSEELPDTQPLSEENSVAVDEVKTNEEIVENNFIEQEPLNCSAKVSKKKSIFKSRSDGSKKRLALYKHKWSDDKGNNPSGNESSSDTHSSQPCAASTEFHEEFEPPKLTRITTWPMTDSDLNDEQEPVTSIKCTRKAKGFYTVVRNVKKAHQIQESGEFQEFNDDVEYILDALQDNNPIGTRCLSAITLATKCMAPAFRMHVRAHGTVAKFFRALHDATKDQSLGLCTATVMFVLSQDRLNMDMDRDSLELMLNLLECDANHDALDDCGMNEIQLKKNKQKVRELCAEIQSQGHAKHLNLENITVGHLAMETLLSLTSLRAGEWFKEELRELGGLEHIVKTICECCRHLDDYIVQWTDPLLDKLKKVDRCLRVLENVTHQNEENQLYLLKYDNSILLDTLVKLFCHCGSEIPLYPVTDVADKDSTGTVIREALLATLKVLINLTHDFNKQSYGSALAGEKPGLIDASLHLLLQIPNYVPPERKFDLLVLALILLINLVEYCVPNRALLFAAKAPSDPENIFHYEQKSAMEALIALFYQQEDLARVEEGKTDAILDGNKDVEPNVQQSSAPKSQEEFIEETVAKLLQKAGQNMEHTLIGAYVAILIGYLVMENKTYELHIRQFLPDGNFKNMLGVLQKVLNFMNLTASAVGISRGIAQTEKVINYLIKSDAEMAANFNDSLTSTSLLSSTDDEPIDASISSLS